MSLTICRTAQFEKDYKRMKKRGFDPDKLEKILDKLKAGEQLPPKNRDHALVGDYVGFRECHITPDWLKCRYRHFSHYADF